MSQAYSRGKRSPLLTGTIGEHLDKIASDNPDHPALAMPHQGIRWRVLPN